MHAVLQERSYMRGTLPELGLKEVFLKNENLGMKKFIYSFIIYLVFY